MLNILTLASTHILHVTCLPNWGKSVASEGPLHSHSVWPRTPQPAPPLPPLLLRLLLLDIRLLLLNNRLLLLNNRLMLLIMLLIRLTLMLLIPIKMIMMRLLVISLVLRLLILLVMLLILCRVHRLGWTRLWWWSPCNIHPPQSRASPSPSAI